MTDLLEQLKAFEGRELGAVELGPDPVNQPMIRHWVEAIGDDNPVYTDADAAAASVHGGIVAPPVMLQAWVMRGIRPRPATGGNPRDELMRLLDDAGFTSVVATNCEQEYHRYVRPGDHLRTTTTIESVSPEKQTALGAGHFVTTRVSYHDQHGELVGSMLFRILKFKPPEAGCGDRAAPEASASRDHPGQRVLLRGRHPGQAPHPAVRVVWAVAAPAGPMCGACRSLEWDTVEASGRGVVYSFVVNHHPQVAAFDYPLVVALVELEEGTRLVSNIVGVDAHEVHVGMPVEVEFVAFDDELTLPQFHPARSLGLMDFTFTEEQEAVRDLAGQIFAGHASADRVKEVEAGDERFDRALWAELAAANLLGIALPDEVGGSGFGVIELCLLLEQQGRRVSPVPLWPTLVLGALPIAEFGTAEQRERWLPGRRRGRRRAQRRARVVRAGADRTGGRRRMAPRRQPVERARRPPGGAGDRACTHRRGHARLPRRPERRRRRAAARGDDQPRDPVPPGPLGRAGRARSEARGSSSGCTTAP